MKLYSYRLDHDYGLAPNPFSEYCTLAVCKSTIRHSKNLEIGDWIIGTGSKVLEKKFKRILVPKLIYAMEVCEKMTFDFYWEDPRFQCKKPVMNGSLITMFGDNFYHRDAQGNWIQENSAHSNIDGTCNVDHLKQDTNGENVLISNHFYYFGSCAIPIPTDFHDIICKGRGQKISEGKIIDDFIDWLKTNKQGIHGDPINWTEYNQLKLL